MFFIVFQIKYKIKKKIASELKWKKFDIADTNYLNIITNTNEPSQHRSETNQSEDPINPELNEENPEDGFGEPPEIPKDELHRDSN